MKKIRREDEVIVVAGKDKGKRGKVNRVLPDGLSLIHISEPTRRS